MKKLAVIMFDFIFLAVVFLFLISISRASDCPEYSDYTMTAEDGTLYQAAIYLPCQDKKKLKTCENPDDCPEFKVIEMACDNNNCVPIDESMVGNERL